MHTNLAWRLRNCVAATITKKGVYPHHCLWRRGDRIFHFRTEGLPEYLVRVACELLLRHGAEELIFGFDAHEKDVKKMGLPYADGLVVGHFRDKQWHVGVLAYRYAPIMVDEFNWHNAVAQGKLRGMIERYLAERAERTKKLALPDKL